MKTLKKIALISVMFVAIPLVVALFVKKEYTVKREIEINKPSSEVFKYIKYQKNHDNFVTWSNMDPEMKKTYKGTDGTVGFISAWESDNKDVGVGEQEITAIKDGERIDFEMRFFEPFKAEDQGYMITEQVTPNVTKFIWGYDGKMNYPSNLLMLFMDFETLIGDEFEKSLLSLKIILEK